MKAWFPILVPPLAALAQQSTSYALVAMECGEQQRLPVHAVAMIALLVALAGVVIAFRDWRAAGVAIPQDAGDQRSRARFLAIVGVSISALMALVMIAMWLTAVFILPCMR
jgi:hypothetical protein